MEEQNQTQASIDASKLAGKYLTFALANEKYGLDILKVQEIIGVLHITPVPRSEHHLKGVINLRGKIIPVVDLRIKFGLVEVPYDEKTCIIVVNMTLAGRNLQVGVVVDTVLEVCSFNADSIEIAPEYGASLDSRFVLGLGRTLENALIILIDIQKALEDKDNSWAINAVNMAK